MKIQNDPLHALLEQDEIRKRSAAGANGFDVLLARELQQEQGSAAGLTPEAGRISAALAMQIRATQELGGAAREEENNGEEFMGGLDGLLDQWEEYAASLKNPTGSTLKSLHSALGSLDSGLAALKAKLPGAPELGNLVNELEVLTATERFKLNRGDYLPG